MRNKDVIRQFVRVALGEVVCVAIMLLVYVVLGYFTLKVLWGALLGGALAILNFLFLSMAVTRAADRAVRTGNAQGATLSIQASAVFRLLGMGAVLVLAFRAKLCDPLAALLPLLLAQLSINLTEYFRKDGEESK